MTIPSQILIGIVTGAYGIKGGVRLKSFAESYVSLKSYKLFYDESGLQEYKIQSIRPFKENIYTLFFEGITTRTAAEQLKNTALYINSSQLSTPGQGEYYYHHLKGLKVFNELMQEVGVVKAINDYGSGEIIEIESYKTLALLLVPFRSNFIIDVQIENNLIIVDSEFINSLLTLNGF